MIYIENKKKKKATLLKKYPNAEIIDVSSKGDNPFVKLSPFYPHGEIPIPPYQNNISNYYSQTVEGIWQGLKVFESEDIDKSKFQIKNMEGIKRTVRKFGKPLGHRNGIDGKELLDYPAARKEIYLRAYAWTLENKLQDVILLLREKALKQDLVLLDYNTNEDLEDYSKPLSHAGLVKKYLFKKYPELENLTFALSMEAEKKPKLPLTKTKRKSKKKTEENKRIDGIQTTLW